ncbi:MAG: isocitrate lyase/phosphoenolpyruvate mutase family protein [Hoeflea sp.]|uniref:isocitrate lyase/PEP mutase family protein n=1 Tax=Hoeflea sp. TaxID=1940281 RepID=UPI001D547759|nr:isocitrate lyase/phosphoenolpyruvate mutase family protein [Hoeflea sp.]MBU4531392.1 isocitrate lyase/phosphoenolpyruvate mutase family protein [Alphaproteobacteria bacterium]MBU4544249.1 isocitrate lyase/phosphoenolpyruvate mutase family protein [Alphaproteobacteria bacterium]MBU4550514.1 isocitrate lyase/phosphoenolpyruvate mutase family protein [Alphaproteobacteria bacterium]MBV1724668.1 isocitrate lyase/phosphoenolpyruvate mutase family protein [Hoeflea sp.]MBV1760688.1 isocitrate lyase
MNPNEKARVFASLHKKGDPVILYNVWDAGSAAAVADAGASALATGSAPVAFANGFADGEQLPMQRLFEVARSIVGATELPVSIDFEGAYATDPEEGARNVGLLVDTGAIGLNFEDQVVGGAGLHPVSEQAARIAAIRAMARDRGVELFINARTDLFLKEKDASAYPALMTEAIARARAYADAGASGFFAPGLDTAELIGALCDASPLPVNIIMRPGVPDAATLAKLGVSRISHGPYPYRAMIERLTDAARAALSAASS